MNTRIRNLFCEINEQGIDYSLWCVYKYVADICDYFGGENWAIETVYNYREVLTHPIEATDGCVAVWLDEQTERIISRIDPDYMIYTRGQTIAIYLF